MDQVAQLHIGPVLQYPHPRLHQHVLVELFLLADFPDVVLIHNNHQQQDGHKEQHGEKYGGHSLEEALRVKEAGGHLDIVGALPPAEGKTPQRGHHV